jgi:hypothetical protein
MIGIGIDEGSAVLRQGAGPIEVVRGEAVSVYVPAPPRAFTLRLLRQGERIDLPAPAKER